MGKGDFLGEFEQLVLLALMRLGEESYGVSVRQELEQTAGRRVSIGAVYATLERLEQKGYVRSRHSAPDPKRGGKPRRHFMVQPAGEIELARTRDVLDRMWEGVSLADRGGGR